MTQVRIDPLEGDAVGDSISPAAMLRHGLRQVMAFDERNRHLARKLLLTNGVWFSQHVYSNFPVLLPWVVRDSGVKKKPEQGTAAPATGFERQDNSPVGGMKKNLPVFWATHPAVFKKKPLGKGWWQCHVWNGAATEALTNTFVANLVWLPEPIGQLTDVKPNDPTLTIFQEEAKRIAWSLYRHLPVPAALENVVEDLWASLGKPPPDGLTREDLELVNYFHVTPSFLASRQKAHLAAFEAVTAAIERRPVNDVDLTPAKYRDSLVVLDQRVLLNLRRHLEPFAAAARDFEMPRLAALLKSKGAGGGAAGEFLVTTAVGQVGPLPRSRAGLAVIAGAIEAGLTPKEVLTCIPEGAFKSVDGTHSGDALVAALKHLGVKGVPSKWFVDRPIQVDKRTWVVNLGVWTKAYEGKMEKLCALTDGAVNLRKLQDPEADV